MTSPCAEWHVFWEGLPDGVALYPFGPDYYKEMEAVETLDKVGTERLAVAAGPNIYLDLGGTDYLTSAGLASLFRLHKEASARGGRVVLCRIRAKQRMVLEIVQFHRLLAMSDDDVPHRTLRLPDPAWLGGNGGAALALAREVRAGRNFDLLPVLADALEDSGCDNADLLAHCRAAGPHRAGCWALRLLLDARTTDDA